MIALPPPGRKIVAGGAGAAHEIVEEALSDSDLDELRAELLEPDSWGEILSKYGRSTRLAVALTDIHGNLLGPCYNPQPVWNLARHSKTESGPACTFCLAPNVPCEAVADAFATRDLVYVQDGAGLAHVAIPLFLGNQRLGALLAGQTFAKYPQQMALQRVAKYYRASHLEIWTTAVRQVPVSQAALRVYADLLTSLGGAFLRQRYAAILDRKLHKTDQRYRLMIEGSKDHALFTIDGTGCVTSWNPGAERLYGYTESEIKGQDYGRFFTPEDIRSGLHDREIQMAEQSGWIEEEGWQVRKNGTRFLAEIVTARLGEGDAREYGRLLHDVTEERETAAALLHSQKLESIGVLAGGIAHDFNNLLTSILGNVSLAMARLPADDSSRPLLGIAQRSGVKAAGLIAQLLAYAGKGDVLVTRFDLSELISETLPLIQTSISKAVQLNLFLKPGLPWIEADSSAVQQIVMNLVINGAEAIGTGHGRVRVSTGVAEPDAQAETPRDRVYLEVQDSGCGMDEATKSRIFDPFFTTKFAGRGLGLAAVSGIVRRLKGQMDVQSAPGKGSTFRIVFPGVPAPIPEPKATIPTELHGTGTILVVDDDPLVRELASAMLERFGYSVLTAEDGEAAVGVFRSHADTIRAVLLDLTMPMMGGAEAFRLMSEIRPNIPIIITTGYGETGVREQFTSALAGVIQKPYTVVELSEKIAEALAVRKTPETPLAGRS